MRPEFSGESLTISAPDSSDARVVASGAVESYQWSPAGSQFLLVTTQVFRHAIEVVNLDGSGRRILFHNNDTGYARWLDEGTFYFAASLSDPFRPETWRISRAPTSGAFVESLMAIGFRPMPRP